MDFYDELIKIVILGDSFTGKSTFTNKICYENYDIHSEYYATLGTDINFTFMNNLDQYYKIIFYDTSGNIDFINIVRCYYKGCDVCILFFDISNKETFKNISFWMHDLTKNLPSSIGKVLIGNKKDIKYEENNFVTYEEAKELADNFNFEYYEISVLYDETSELKKIIRNSINNVKKDKELLKINDDKFRYKCCKNCIIL
jgi:small GTP-binding protein